MICGERFEGIAFSKKKIEIIFSTSLLSSTFIKYLSQYLLLNNSSNVKNDFQILNITPIHLIPNV